MQIDAGQQAALAAMQRKQFIDAEVVRLSRLLAGHLIASDEPAMLALVGWGLELAERLEISERAQVQSFLDLFAFADIGFPVLGQWEWLRVILAQTERPAAHRLDDVYAELIVQARHATQ